MFPANKWPINGPTSSCPPQVVSMTWWCHAVTSRHVTPYGSHVMKKLRYDLMTSHHDVMPWRHVALYVMSNYRHTWQSCQYDIITPRHATSRHDITWRYTVAPHGKATWHHISWQNYSMTLWRHAVAPHGIICHDKITDTHGKVLRPVIITVLFCLELTDGQMKRQTTDRSRCYHSR